MPEAFTCVIDTQANPCAICKSVEPVHLAWGFLMNAVHLVAWYGSFDGSRQLGTISTRGI